MADKEAQNRRRLSSDCCSDSEDISTNEMCVYCQKDKIQFVTKPCRHKGACKKCAMRLGTGGKCKTCKDMFVGWQAYIK